MGDTPADHVVDRIGTALAVLDTEGVVVYANEPWHRLDSTATLPGTAAVGDPLPSACATLADAEGVARLRNGLAALLAGERDRVDTTYAAPRSGGFPRRFRARVRRFSADGDERVLVEHTETTEQARVRRERDHYRAVLADVTTVVSHDIRSPMTAALSWAELLAADPDTDSDKLSRIVSAVERLDAMADAAVRLARETGVDALDPVDPGGVARRLWGDLDTAGELVVETTGPVLADEHSLEALLSELLRNAIRHGTADGTPATVRLEPLPDGFSIQDDGPGVDDDLRGTLFEPGVTTAAADDATGLGLAIVERAAEAHGWTVDHAETGGGARFEITGVNRPPDHTP